MSIEERQRNLLSRLVVSFRCSCPKGISIAEVPVRVDSFTWGNGLDEAWVVGGVGAI